MQRYLFKRQQQLTELIQEFLAEAKFAQTNFSNAMDLFFTTGKCCPDFDFLVGQTHEAESKSDDVKAKIETFLYEKTLIPDFRADVLQILDQVDDVPDQFDRVLYAIQTQNMALPRDLVEDVQQLVAVSMQACNLMQECIECLFCSDRDISKLHAEIDRYENHGDHIERRTIKRIFESEASPLDKILLKDLIMLIGDIADHVKEVGRLMNILMIKRRV